jgi:hypothetical protein
MTDTLMMMNLGQQHNMDTLRIHNRIRL